MPALDETLDDGTELARRMRPHYIRLLEQAWGDAAGAGLVRGAFDLDNPFIQDQLDTIATRITGIADTSREQVREIEGQAAREGWSVAERTARYTEVFESWTTSRAELVARTESATAYTKGSIAAYQASGEVDQIEWLTAGSDVCDICVDLNGMVVAIGDEFAPGIEHVPAHPACRCVILPVVRT